MSAGTYDASKVSIIFAGIIFSGYADGTFIEAERNVDTFTTVVGADGTVTRVRSANKTGKIKVTLMGSSISNDALAAAHLLDELAGTGLGPFMMKDLNGSELVIAANTWIVKPAATSKGKELANREWNFECENLQMVGGAILG